MHETALAEGILRIVRGEAKRCGVRRVTEIRLAVGLLSAVEAESLRACFELLAEGGVAEGAKLRIDPAPLPARCRSCGHGFELHVRRFVCPRCSGPELDLDGGRGCLIRSISAECIDDTEENTA